MKEQTEQTEETAVAVNNVVPGQIVGEVSKSETRTPSIFLVHPIMADLADQFPAGSIVYSDGDEPVKLYAPTDKPLVVVPLAGRKTYIEHRTQAEEKQADERAPEFDKLEEAEAQGYVQHKSGVKSEGYKSVEPCGRILFAIRMPEVEDIDGVDFGYSVGDDHIYTLAMMKCKRTNYWNLFSKVWTKAIRGNQLGDNYWSLSTQRTNIADNPVWTPVVKFGEPTGKRTEFLNLLS